jgi:hypothetical protein
MDWAPLIVLLVVGVLVVFAAQWLAMRGMP